MGDAGVSAPGPGGVRGAWGGHDPRSSVALVVGLVLAGLMVVVVLVAVAVAVARLV